MELRHVVARFSPAQQLALTLIVGIGVRLLLLSQRSLTAMLEGRPELQTPVVSFRSCERHFGSSLESAHAYSTGGCLHLRAWLESLRWRCLSPRTQLGSRCLHIPLTQSSLHCTSCSSHTSSRLRPILSRQLHGHSMMLWAQFHCCGYGTRVRNHEAGRTVMH